MQQKNIVVNDRHGRTMATDVFLPEKDGRMPVIIYAHGFNGFKDWGNFDLIAERLLAAGFVFIKFNFALNGTSLAEPETFVDLDAYAANNYTTELDNLEDIINWVCADDQPFAAAIDTGRIGLIGHSLGGGIAVIKASEDRRVKALCTWAAVASCTTPWTHWPATKLHEWQKEGVAYTMNSRTQQQMPLKYQLYEDYQDHKARLDEQAAAGRLHIPWLICHGSEDPAVPVSAAMMLHDWQPASELFLLDTDHVFGRKHPWASELLPAPMEAVLARTLEFFGRSL